MTAVNPYALAFSPPATPAPEVAAPSLSLCDLPSLALQNVLRLLTLPEDVARCAATCKAARLAARHAALELTIALPLSPDAGAPPPVLPSGLLARAWLRVTRLDLSGAFLAEDEVVAALCGLPQLQHLSLLGCQKVTGEAPLLAALEAAPALLSFSAQQCFSLRASAAHALLAACLDGRCALRTLVLGSAALDFGDMLPRGSLAASAPPRSRLRVLALPSCCLTGMRHAAAALARAPLGALLLSGCAVGGDGDDDGDGDGALNVQAPPAESGLEAAAEPEGAAVAVMPAPPAQLLVLESTQSVAGERYAAHCSAAAAVETWDLLHADCAQALAALGATRLRARLAAASPPFAAVSAHELRAALAASASASAPPRRSAPLHVAAQRSSACHVAALLALGGRADARDVSGATPLFVAAEAGASGACEALLAAGAALEARTAAGEGPAYIAALKGRTDACRVLLAAARVRGLPAHALANDDGWTPLHAAAVAGRVGILHLCCAGAGMDGANRFGQTALHLAARRGSDELCQLLVRAGASAHVRDGRGAAPADVALRHGYAALAAALHAQARPPGKKDKQRRRPQRQEQSCSV